MSSKIRVAIIGGGTAGASLIHALLQYPNIDAHIFESAPKFKEAGIAFGLTRNATQALSLLGPSASKCLERAGGVEMKGVCFSVAQGKDSGKSCYIMDNEKQGKGSTTIVQRANYLREILADIPEERMHTSKKLEKVERKEDGAVVVHFADGSTHECDIVVGADGIRSTVRKIILGENDPAVSPRNTGWLALMTLQPYEKARASFGEAPINIEDAREYSWAGDNVFLLHNILSDGQIVQFSVCTKDEKAEGTDQWQKIVSKEWIEETFTHKEHPPHLNKAVKELLCDQPEQPAIYLWDHLPAHTYVDGPLAMIGDAAHATTPWQGSGGGMCIEDSLILSTLLGKAQSRKEAWTALKVYDQVRRPRTQRLVESSYLTGQIITGQTESGLDADKLQKVLAPRWDFILDHDNAKHREEAVQLMQAEINGKSA